MGIPTYGVGTDLPFLSWRIAKKVSSAFDGGTTNAHGDFDGTGNPYTLFTVIGDVIIHFLIGVCNTNLAGAAANIYVGTPGGISNLISSTLATDIDADMVWNDATPTADIGSGYDVMLVIANGADIRETIETANITAGQIDYYCIWAPLEAGASVVAA